MSSISAVLIAKNEEALLPRCLNSVKDLDGIVVCDTGSTDRTLEVAREFDAVTCQFPWCDDFSKARNYALSHATTDWILSIDCDEFLHDVDAVRETVVLAEAAGALAVSVRMIAEDNGQWFWFPRLFKRSPRVWWEGAIHNHISVTGFDAGNVQITHGFSPAHHQDPHRALRILERVVKETGNAREMYYLGREYWYKKQYDEAIRVLRQYVGRSEFLPEKADAFLFMARAHWLQSRPDDARVACAQALILNPRFKEAALFMAELSGDGRGVARWQANADQWKRMAASADNEDVLFVRDL